MYSNLTQEGVKVPNGFALTAFSYREFVRKAGIDEKIRDVLSDLDTSDMQNLREKGHQVRDLIRGAEFPEELKTEVKEAYEALCKDYGEHTDVAVRSSATAEDLPDASFAGQQETFLNIKGPSLLLEACKKCFASLFTNRAISYREDKGFDHFDVALSVGVQKMVRSDKASSGVMFSIDTESGFRDAILITSAYGLGENVVLGNVNPDEFYVHKPTLKQGYEPIIYRKVGKKQQRMVYDEHGSKTTKNTNVPKEEREQFSITDEEVLQLAKWAARIEEHYSAEAGHHKPMDMEWAKDGETGELFIVQARPETVQSRKDTTQIEKYRLDGNPEPFVVGRSVGAKVGNGKAKVIKDADKIDDFNEGEVLVTDMTDPDWEPIMKIASAIVTNRGGRTCHAAIISRELGIPCVVGTDTGTKDITTGHPVTVDCSQGDEGYVYNEKVDYHVEKHDVKDMPRPHTKVMMNLATPSQAFEKSFLPNDGVGLAREEFVINSEIQVHPLALKHYHSLEDESLKDHIDEITKGYRDKEQFFVDKLSEGVGMIAAAFYPKPVVVRLSDFKSNEYANLVGGHLYEPEEDNPMIGWRGASRYYSEKYRPAFDMECRALKKVRDEYGLTNVKLMVPFCRTVEEGKKVIEALEDNGLKQGENGLEVYAMCEIPSNVLLAEDFLDVFDGFSIGSNDLTQLTLGVDRDSELVSHVYDERSPAVKQLIRRVVEIAEDKGKYIGICGQAPSDFPDFAEFLVETGIHSMSLNPDTVIKTRLKISEKEEQL
jgi:pyruvate,water dikinase